MKSIPSIKDNWHWYAFFALLIVTVSPVFMMDYLITLDGPNHLYNSAVFNRLISNDSFSQSFMELNPQITPNYASLLILSFLLIFVNGVVALKIFHFLFVVLFALSFAYWNKKEHNFNSAFLVFPLIFSYLFISGFYNFILAIIIMFWILTFYEKTKYSSTKKYALLAVLLVVLYFSHSIVFAFSGLALVMFELTNWLLGNRSIKSLLTQLSLLFLSAIPCIVFAVLFMSARDSEIFYLPFSDLLSNLITSKSIFAKSIIGGFSKLLFILFILISTVIIVFHKLKNKAALSDFLLLTAITSLLLYFILPDSVGYASVFSVRIEYFFWIFLFAWFSRQKLENRVLRYGITMVTTLLIIFQNMEYITFWQPLNSDTKQVLEANQFIESESIVYPIFTSNVWEHYHISNMLGVENNIFILENTAARQNYFPMQYKQPYEKYLDSIPGLKILNTSMTIDYVIKIGKNAAESAKDIKIYSEIRNSGQLIYENNLVELWKRNN